MKVDFPEEILKLFRLFAKHNYQLYLVGGAVRDLMLRKKIKDFDFTTDATPEQILKLLPDGFYDNKFGTVGVNSPEGVVEITTMRKESGYTDTRHPSQIAWTDKIEEDLKRRDFTINSMALGGDNFALVDPFNGQADLLSKIIRAVGDPNKRFSEDALRLMRAVRFACQLGFTIDPLTFEAIKQNEEKILAISGERVRDELLKILASPNPYQGIILLKEGGLLKYLLPEIEKSFGIKQEGPKHDRVYDIGEHSLNSLKFCSSKDPIVRFACLIHDVGKVNTHRIDEKGNATFYGHDIVGGKIAKQICLRLRFSNKQADKIVTLVRWHLFTVDEKQTDSAIRRFVRNVGLENLNDMFILREADRLGGASNPSSWRTEHFKKRIEEVLTKPFSVTDLKVNGKDVMAVLNIPPGRKVGEVLEKLFEEVSEDSSKNTREYLLSRMKIISNNPISN